MKIICLLTLKTRSRPAAHPHSFTWADCGCTCGNLLDWIDSRGHGGASGGRGRRRAEDGQYHTTTTSTSRAILIYSSLRPGRGIRRPRDGGGAADGGSFGRPPPGAILARFPPSSMDWSSAARLAILSPEFVDSGELEPLLAIRNFFWLSEKFWLNSGYFVKMDFTCHESL